MTFFVADGEQFVPRLFAELGVSIRSMSGTRPTLDDVFMSYTGKTIRDAEAANPKNHPPETSTFIDHRHAGDWSGPVPYL